MRNDARAHGVLSESSVSLHIHAHDRKGDRREEIGERKGREGRVETSHHVVAYVTRGARGSAPIVAPSPVTTPDAMMETSVIEHLDFEPTCEGVEWRECGRAADLVVEGHVSAAEGRVVLLCRQCWSAYGLVSLICAVTMRSESRDEHAHIVQVLR